MSQEERWRVGQPGPWIVWRGNRHDRGHPPIVRRHLRGYRAADIPLAEWNAFQLRLTGSPTR